MDRTKLVARLKKINAEIDRERKRFDRISDKHYKKMRALDEEDRSTRRDVGVAFFLDINRLQELVAELLIEAYGRKIKPLVCCGIGGDRITLYVEGGRMTEERAEEVKQELESRVLELLPDVLSPEIRVLPLDLVFYPRQRIDPKTSKPSK